MTRLRPMRACCAALFALLGAAQLPAAIAAEAAAPAAVAGDLAALLDEIDRQIEEGRSAQAKALLEQVRERARAAAAPEYEARALIGLGGIFEEEGNLEQARTLYLEALDLARKAGSAIQEVRSGTALGSVLAGLGQFAEAMRYLDAAAPRARSLGDRGLVQSARFAQGNALYMQARYADAVAPFVEAMEIARERGDRGEQRRIQNNLALAYMKSGQYGPARHHFEESLALALALGERKRSFSALLNSGNLYRELGQHQKAIERLGEALDVAREQGARRNEYQALAGLATAQAYLGKLADAESLYRDAADIARELGDGPAEISIRHNLAALLGFARKYAEAATELEVVAARMQADPAMRSEYLSALANAAIARSKDRGQRQSGLDQLRRVIPRIVAAGDAEMLWKALDALSDGLRLESRPVEAIFFAKQAVATVQDLRRGASSLDRGLRKSMLALRRPIYESLLEQVKNRPADAEFVLRLLKEEEFEAFVDGAPAAARDRPRMLYSRYERPWGNRYEAYVAALAALREERARLAQMPDAARTLPALEARMESEQEALREFLFELDRSFAKNFVATDYGAEDRAWLDEGLDRLGRLGPNVALVHYVAFRVGVHAIVVTPKGRFSVQGLTRMGGPSLPELVAEFRRLLRNPAADPRPAARALYDVLIGPIEAELRARGVKHLMLSLDGILRYVPFAALHDGERWLIESYGMSLFTVAAPETLERKPQARWRVAGLGASAGGQDMSPLPAVREELDGIVREENDPVGVLPGMLRLDLAFTRQAVADALKERPPVVHIASHFAFRPGDERQSFLLLGDGSRLTLADLRTGGFSFQGVDLVTLSACETALESKDAYGREIEGLGTLAQSQGAAAVLATLWPVADASTGIFMQDLYRAREVDALSKAEALRRTQIAFIEGHARGAAESGDTRGMQRLGEAAGAGFARDPDKPYAHPFYWAPFILMGNWL